VLVYKFLNFFESFKHILEIKINSHDGESQIVLLSISLMPIWQLFVGQNSKSICFYYALILIKNQALALVHMISYS